MQYVCRHGGLWQSHKPPCRHTYKNCEVRKRTEEYKRDKNTMLHKGKLQAALQLKKGQFTIYDGSFSDQLQAYRYALETLDVGYPSSKQLEEMLPPSGASVPAGARPTIEFDRWLVSVERTSASMTHTPVFVFGRSFANHEQARQWAECIEGITTVAVDGSQLQPWRDASIPVALIQVGLFANPHANGRSYTKDVRM